MIDISKYEGHNDAPWRTAEGVPYDDEGSHLDIVDANGVLVTETSYFTDNDHPNAQLIADAPLLLEEVKRLREELNRAYDTIQEYEEVIEPKRLNKIERLEKALKSNGRYNAIVDATGNAGRGSIMVDVTFDDGEEYYGILDKVIE